ncbi:MAG TPA: hypothetical protein VIV06_10855, partial [Candidatus Limnocylindrales bacterium]
EAGRTVQLDTSIVAGASLVPGDPDDDLVDTVLAWSTVAVDRYRIRDRLRELRLSPWAGAAGDGALLRAAALRAAVGRLVAATPHASALPAPDLLVAAGGAWSILPGPAITLALADLVRRPGACQQALDHARLLGPLGMIEDGAERRMMLADLFEDALVPLGSVITAQGMHAGREVGRLVVRDGEEPVEADLVSGGLRFVDLPPGRLATAELTFRDPVQLGSRGRRFEIEVGGGLSGLLVDLRDVPLRLPEQADRRRAMLEAWQRVLWPDAQ